MNSKSVIAIPDSSSARKRESSKQSTPWIPAFAGTTVQLLDWIPAFAGMTLLLLAAPAFAIDTSEGFDDPELQARYETIISEVRCMQCQNESLKDSEAFLAADLRREIRRLLSEGKSDAEIYDFLVARYGEFALYRPRTSGKTLFLWIAPLLLLAIGAVVAVKVVRGRMTMPLEDQ